MAFPVIELKITCLPNNLDLAQNLKDKFFIHKTMYNKYSDTLNINIEIVNKIIDSMDENKSPGFDNLTIEHIKYAHPCLILILSKLFNLFLKNGYVPDDFGRGIATPIPKFSGAKSKQIQTIIVGLR